MTDHPPQPTEAELSELKRVATAFVDSKTTHDMIEAFAEYSQVVTAPIVLSLISALEAARQEAAEAQAKGRREGLLEAVKYLRDLAKQGETTAKHTGKSSTKNKLLMVANVRNMDADELEAAAGTELKEDDQCQTS